MRFFVTLHADSRRGGGNIAVRDGQHAVVVARASVVAGIVAMTVFAIITMGILQALHTGVIRRTAMLRLAVPLLVASGPAGFGRHIAPFAQGTVAEYQAADAEAPGFPLGDIANQTLRAGFAHPAPRHAGTAVTDGAGLGTAAVIDAAGTKMGRRVAGLGSRAIVIVPAADHANVVCRGDLDVTIAAITAIFVFQAFHALLGVIVANHAARAVPRHAADHAFMVARIAVLAQRAVGVLQAFHTGLVRQVADLARRASVLLIASLDAYHSRGAVFSDRAMRAFITGHAPLQSGMAMQNTTVPIIETVERVVDTSLAGLITELSQGAVARGSAGRGIAVCADASLADLSRRAVAVAEAVMGAQHASPRHAMAVFIRAAICVEPAGRAALTRTVQAYLSWTALGRIVAGQTRNQGIRAGTPPGYQTYCNQAE